jgi:hypothetical protein
MDLNQFSSKYGKQATDELIDQLLIQGKLNHARMFCIRYGIIKATTKICREYYYKGYGSHTFFCINGRNEEVLRVHFNNNSLNQYYTSQ